MTNIGVSVPEEGFDPTRKTYGFIKDNMPDCPGKIGVAVVQTDEGSDVGELIDFRLCANWQEARGYMALYGLSSEPVWTAPPPVQGHSS